MEAKIKTYLDIETAIRFLAELNPEDLTAEDQQAMDEIREELCGRSQEKVDGFVRVVGSMTARAEQLKAASKDLAEKSARILKEVDRIKSRRIAVMNMFGLRDAMGRLYKLTVHDTFSVEIQDEEALPDDYVQVVTKRQPDKVAIKRDLLSGKEVAGADLVTNQHIRIR